MGEGGSTPTAREEPAAVQGPEAVGQQPGAGEVPREVEAELLVGNFPFAPLNDAVSRAAGAKKGLSSDSSSELVKGIVASCTQAVRARDIELKEARTELKELRKEVSDLKVENAILGQDGSRIAQNFLMVLGPIVGYSAIDWVKNGYNGFAVLFAIAGIAMTVVGWYSSSKRKPK